MHSEPFAVVEMNLLLTIRPLQQSRTPASFIGECQGEGARQRSACFARCVFKGADMSAGALFSALSFQDVHLIKDQGTSLHPEVSS